MATRIEQSFSKKHILELYLNEIYLGNRAYGVAAAAINYFNKSLDELTLEEIAYLAALPKGPNNYNPKTKYDAAIARRNWVIDRMSEDGYVSEEQAEEAKNKPLVVVNDKDELVRYSQYFSEDVRRQVKKEFGEDALYEGGLLIRTTLNPKLQEYATKSFAKEPKLRFMRCSFLSTVTPAQFPTFSLLPVRALYIVVLPLLGLPARATLILIKSLLYVRKASS